MSSQADICQSDDDCLNGGVCKAHSIPINDPTDPILADFLECSCPSGFYGDQCESRCPILCQNNGQCYLTNTDHAGLDVASDFACDCPVGFRGRLCTELEENEAGFSTETTRGASLQEDSSTAVFAFLIASGVVLAITVGCLVGAYWYREKQSKPASKGAKQEGGQQRQAAAADDDGGLAFRSNGDSMEVTDTEVEPCGTMV